MVELVAVILFGGIVVLFYLHFQGDSAFKGAARLFDLHRRQRDTESDYASTAASLERAIGRIGELEGRVARLEDPQGKQKRGHNIYDFYPGIPGLKALEDYEPPAAQVQGGDSPRARYAYSKEHERYVYLGDDGELTAGKENGHG